jgi:transforming growth factor-beta-induced protein
MFNKKSLLSLSVFLVLALVLAACAPAPAPEPTPVETEEPAEIPEPDPQTIVDIAVADGRFETLVTALLEADLAETLAGEGPFTVFAPTDDAFGQLPEGTLEALLADIPALTDILLYHVVSGEVLAEDVVALESAETLLGERVNIQVEDGMVYINDAQVIITDIVADNGVIHVIDSVLLPPESVGSIVDIAVADGRFENLVTALLEADLAETLAGEGPFTVFAPTDDAFSQLPEGTLEALLADIPALTDVLLYHVVSGEVLAEDVVALESAETLLGERVNIQVEDGMVYINDAQVIITDIVADNGVIHVIDSVLLPPEPVGSIVDIAVADGRFENLVTALLEADLAETLAGEGPFTVFAPTDDAFSQLPEGTLEALLADIPALTDVLLYHVVSGEVLAEDVVALESAETLLGERVNIQVEDGMVYINDAQVIITDIVADNGVIHVIDSVLLPPESVGSIVDIAVADGRFENLVTALLEADLAETLAGEGPFTVFAPTDEAFGHLPEGTLEALLADIPALTDVLLYHVVSGEVLAEDVITLEEAETFLGENVSIRVDHGSVFINDSEVIITDIIADNGVIHVIDAVLLPPAN